jgi:hypothetical protein
MERFLTEALESRVRDYETVALPGEGLDSLESWEPHITLRPAQTGDLRLGRTGQVFEEMLL